MAEPFDPFGKGAVQVRGLNDLRRAFLNADRAVERDLRDALEEAAAPVRSDAQSFAKSVIKPGKIPWSAMRTGTVKGSIVYVAPVQRGVRGRSTRRREKLADLLMEQAMKPALQRNTGAVERRLNHMLGEVEKVWERT